MHIYIPEFWLGLTVGVIATIVVLTTAAILYSRGRTKDSA